MCGLVGCVGAITKKEEDAFSLLLGFDTIRGPHSTGVAFIHHRDEPIIAKATGTPWDLFATEDYRKGIARANAALIGHNRFATRGGINADNAHPFKHGHIIGAHNGTLTRQSLLKEWQRFDVDSDNLFYDMAESGHKSTIKRLDGAFALSWHDAFNDTVNLCRNNQRPLFYVFTKDNKTVFWASEAWMLSIALGRTGIDHHEFKELGVAEWVSFEVPDCFPSQVKPIKEYLSEKVDLIPAYEYDYHWRGNSQQKNDERKDTKDATTNNSSSGSGGSATGHQGTEFQDLLTQYRKNRIVEFYVAEEVRKPKGGNLAPHILGYTQDEHGVEVRIYQEPGSPVWKRLASSPDWFRAEVRTTNLTGVNTGHITIDPRSLVDIGYDELSAAAKLAWDKVNKPNETPYKGFNNEPLTAIEYVELTNAGCACCNEISSTAEAGLILWMSADHYLCKKCCLDPEIVRIVEEDLTKKGADKQLPMVLH